MFSLFVVLFCCMFVLLNDKTYMTNIFSGESLYLENLKSGDYVETGALLYADGKHSVSTSSSQIQTVYLHNYTFVCFSKEDDDECDDTDYVFNLVSGANVIPKYSDIFSGSSNYSGWIFKKMMQESANSSGKSFSILMVPSNEYSTITSEPSSKNKYTIEGKCVGTNVSQYAWYKNLDLDYEVSFKNSTDGMQGYLWSTDSWHFLTNGVDFTISFNANDGDIFRFDYSILSFANDNLTAFLYTKISLNDEQLYFVDYKSMLFNTYDIPIKTTGEQRVTLTFYEYKHTFIGGFNLFINNAKLLRLINDSSSLATEGLLDNESVYYTYSCGNNLVADGMISYLKLDDDSQDSSNDDKNEPDDNNGNEENSDKESNDDKTENDVPNTGAFLSLGVIILLLLCGIAFLLIAEKKKKIIRM